MLMPTSSPHWHDNYTLNGGAMADYVDIITYSGLAAITVDMNAGTVTKSGGTDTISSIESISGTSNSISSIQDLVLIHIMVAVTLTN